ncbi:MAG: hypothetical protein ACRDJN_27955 [Chloroflexota bacterium]
MEETFHTHEQSDGIETWVVLEGTVRFEFEIDGERSEVVATSECARPQGPSTPAAVAKERWMLHDARAGVDADVEPAGDAVAA